MEMDLPRQYPYNPRPRLIFLTSGAGILWIGLQRLVSGQAPTAFGLWFGLAPIVLALVVGLRRVCFDRSLLLEKEEMVLPTGFLQASTTRIAYSSIQRVWRHYLPATIVLRVATNGR